MPYYQILTVNAIEKSFWFNKFGIESKDLTTLIFAYIKKSKQMIRNIPFIGIYGSIKHP